AQILLILLDLLIASRQVERDLRHVVDAGVPDVVDRNAGISIALLDLPEAVGRTEVGSGADTDVFGAELLQEQQVGVGGLGGGPGAELDPGLHRRRGFGRGEARGSQSGGVECAPGHPRTPTGGGALARRLRRMAAKSKTASRMGVPVTSIRRRSRV